MHTSELEKYKVDHLFLLMGKNPLPNYVVAKSGALLRPGGKLYLVYTSDTRKYADTLRDMLELTNDELVPLESYDSNAYEIKNRITSKAKDLKGRLGLNYTGGTKAMSVNAYLAILSIERSEKPVFSYLDPRSLKLCIDQENTRPIELQILCKRSLQEIFQLHQLSLMNPPTTQPMLPDLAKVILEEGKEWRTWCNTTLLPNTKKIKSNSQYGNWHAPTVLQGLELPMDGLSQYLIESFKNRNLLTSERCLSIQKMQNIGSFTKSEHVCKWLDGIWLENYLLEKIISISEPYSISEYGMSFNIKANSKSGFEFDVAFMRNYQLFAFSCTSDDEKSRCKSKLFEAYIRTKQLGGEEARVALVCCSDEPEVLKAELEVAIEDSKINVFGRKHLADLPGAISTWIDNLERNSQ